MTTNQPEPITPQDFDQDSRSFSLNHLELLFANQSGTPSEVLSSPIHVREEDKVSFPFTWEQALVECVKNRDMGRKIGAGYYRDRLVLIVNTPKSASTAFRNCVSYLHRKHQGVPRVGLAAYMAPNSEYDLRIEMLKDFPQGGVLKRPLRPVGKNLKIIEDLGLKTVLLFRHPKDQIVAWLCQLINSPDETRRYNPMYPETSNPCPDEDLDGVLAHYIRSGMVCNMLQWMVDWLRLQPPERSAIVRYEDLMDDRDATFDRVCQFLYGRGLESGDLEAMNQLLGHYKEFREKTMKYPRGYTGKVGTWKDYLSDENSALFDDVARRFLDVYDPDSSLLNLYDFEGVAAPA